MSFSLSDTKQWDATITGTGSITLVKYQDISSLQLAQAASQRLLFPLATFAVAKKKKSAEQQEYLKWTLENVFVSSIMVRPSLDNRTPPVEFITLTFQKGIWQEGTPRITSSYFPPLTP
jgi:type VI protein secretion system component Hcp